MHRHAARQSTETANGDRGVGAVFEDREIRAGKINRARPVAIVAADELRDVIARLGIHRGEHAADDDQAVGDGLERDGVDRVVRARAEVDRRVETAIRAGAVVNQPRDAPAPDAGESREVAADEQEISDGIQRHGIHRAVRSDPRIENRIDRAIGIQARQIIQEGTVDRGEIAADHDLARGINADRADARVRPGAQRVEAGVDRAIGIQPRDARRGRAVDRAEITAQQHAPEGINRDRAHRAVGPAWRRERGVHAAVQIQPRDAIARDAINRGEISRDDHLAVRRLDDHAVNRVVSAGAGIERNVQRTIQIEPRDPAADDATDIGETAADQRAPDERGLHGVRVNRQRKHRVVRPRAQARERRCVHRAIDIQARDAVARRAVHAGETTADHPFAIHRGRGVLDQRDDGDFAIRTVGGIERGIERTRGQIDQFVVHDGQDRGLRRCAAGQNRAARGIHQLQIHELVSTRDGVVDDRNRDAGHGLARGEKHVVRHRHVIRERRGDARADLHERLKLHADGAGDAVGADDGDDREVAIFRHAVIGGTERERAVGEIVVEDRDRRRIAETENWRDGDVGQTEGNSRVGEIGQCQLERAVPIHQRVGVHQNRRLNE